MRTNHPYKIVSLIGPMVVSAGLVCSPASAQTSAAKASEVKPADAKSTESTQDTLIFRSGNVLLGTIVSENENVVRFRSEVSGIPFEVDYGRDQILEVKRAAKAVVPVAAKDAAPSKKTDAPVTTPGSVPATGASDATTESMDGKQRVYWVKLEGKFGEDITQTPLRQAIADAKANNVDVLIVELNNDWSNPQGLEEDLPDAAAQFDEFHRAERIMPVFVDEMPTEFVKMPRIVFWVHKAMGGSAFLPFVSKEIYFAPDGKIGGVGNLATMMRGHERVVQKQISLRLQRAVGWANVGGYPEQLIRAMTQDWYVLSVKFADGKIQYLERLPEGPDEELLTDDAKEGNRDTIDAIARNTGNDVLTLDARKAELLQVSKGTVTTRDQLLSALGLSQTAVMIDGKSAKIMSNWADGLARARLDIAKLMGEYRDVQVRAPAGWNERRAARSTRINRLQQLRGILDRWKEALDAQFLYQLGIPLNEEGEPDLSVIDFWIKGIKTEQELDKNR